MVLSSVRCPHLTSAPTPDNSHTCNLYQTHQLSKCQNCSKLCAGAGVGGVLHCCVVIGSVRYQQWLLNNELATPGEIDRDAGLITGLHSARLLLTINILHTMLIHCSPHTMGQELDTLISGHCD